MVRIVWQIKTRLVAVEGFERKKSIKDSRLNKSFIGYYLRNLQPIQIIFINIYM
jgi:hypothetical protein